ncbi:MAG: tetraacyldisaccharide 4'-kinase [SAR86 cluster bacterium]|uniref:Tetraacyldisaccharide 4'-kinase n=1 Tax=SAR86 cluster bacterium TaxID=2030880 RepID=A0A2A5C9F2_9GAMM|nr:tetraacyldisaccharide 4'-kinase [bacterium AH-315-I11]PCJ40457.1 MAG: tetraacyldisaccharide 4'-kinase [SAR86 cluster bacterium]
MKKIVDTWYGDSAISWLKPVSALFSLISRVRRKRYTSGRKKAYRASVPLIIVGNITVGGTGKTPLIVYLAKQLLHAGYRPGIVSRGYGSKAPSYPFHVKKDSPVNHSGDEALVVARNTECPVVIAADRAEAVKSLEQHYDCNVILSDDGMQHYAIARDIEIAVVDGRRGFGNGELLPAGPLREKPERLNEVDYIICNGECNLSFNKPAYMMTLKPRHLCHLLSGEMFPIPHIVEEMAKSREANQTTDTDAASDENLTGPSSVARHKVHAIAGIGNPERFFSSLCDCGFDIISHVFDDHHAYSLQDISFNDDYEIIMTEKDAVKCVDFARKIDWYLRVDAVIDEAFIESLLIKLKTFSI